MAEYIKRETLLERAEYDNNYRLIIPAEAIKAAPAADVAQVVRCKNCRSYNKPKTGWCEVHLDREHPDDFCGYGEQKDGGASNG